MKNHISSIVRKSRAFQVSKRLVVLACFLLACLLILGAWIFFKDNVMLTGISAFLSDGDMAGNRFPIGGVNIEVEEEYTPEKATPGGEIPKRVQIKNTGPNDAYVRIKVAFSDSDMEKLCTIDWNLTEFVYCEEDGFFYAPKILKAGDVTPALMTKVIVSEDADPTKIKDFEIYVYADAYQAKNFADYREAYADFEKNR